MKRLQIGSRKRRAQPGPTCGRPRRLAIEPLEHRALLSGSDPFAAPNVVCFGGEGFGNLAFTPHGQLAELLWLADGTTDTAQNSLMYRVRDAVGAYSAEVVAANVFQTSVHARSAWQAQLLFATNGTPHVLLRNAADGLDHYVRSGSGWTRTEVISLPVTSYENIAHLATAVGTDGSFHFVATVGYWGPYNIPAGRMLYGTNASGAWVVQQAVAKAAVNTFDVVTAHERRFVSLALDSTNHAHVAYVPEFLDNGDGTWSRPYSQLAYATNASGAWTTQIVHQPADDSGETSGASIAVGPNGEIGIAEFYVERVSTGSAQYSRLYYHQRQTGGTWSTETVASSPDGYVAGDGANFVGFAPQLLFDAAAAPHIAFSDHASQHFPGYGADEYAGQIRHAVKTGGVWNLQTIVRQTDPLRNMMVYPTMALTSNEIMFAGLRRPVTIDANGYITSSEYYLVQASIPQTGLTVAFADAAINENRQTKLVVTRHNGSTAGALSVTLALNDSSEASLPTAVTILAGASSAEVVVHGIDDLVTDGPQTVKVTASATGYLPGADILQVTDPLPPQPSTVGLYDPLASTFYLRYANDWGNPDNIFTLGIPWPEAASAPPPGAKPWTPFAGDWNGDNVDTVGLYDPTTSWIHLRNSNSAGAHDVCFGFGVPGAGWTTLVGDWDGNGTKTIGLFDPTSSTFFLRNSLDSGYADVTFGYGAPGAGWQPIVADWNGDGIDTVGFFDRKTFMFYLRNTNTMGMADIAFPYGAAGSNWITVMGDWDGNGTDTIGFYLPDASHFFLRNSNTVGMADIAFGLGVPGAGWLPIAGSWTQPATLLATDVQTSAVTSAPLDADAVRPVFDAAAAHWNDRGVSLASVRLVVTDLPGRELGEVRGSVLYLDRDAAGHGWFIDTTPASDEEFARLGSDSQLTAVDGRAADKIDLLTVIEHELGHTAGLDDLDASATSLMSSVLPTGVRRAVTANAVDALFAQ